MTVTTVRPANSNQDGWVRAENAVYATAWAAANGSSSSQTNNTTISGQTNSPAYHLYNALFGPDVSVITSTDTASGVVFEYTMAAAYTHTSDLRIVGIDHGGGITTADYVDGAAAAALTVWGTIPAANGTSGSTYQVSLNAAGVAAAQAAITAGIPFRFGIVSDDFCNGTAPTGDRRWTIHSSEATTAANRPALIVTHAAPEVTVSPPAGALALAAQTPLVAADAVTLAPAATLMLAGAAPALAADAVTRPPAGTLALAGLAATVLADAVVVSPLGLLTLTAQTPLVAADALVTAPAGSLIFAALSPLVAADGLVRAPAGALALDPYAPTVGSDGVVFAPVSALTLAAYGPVVTTVTLGSLDAELWVGPALSGGVAAAPALSGELRAGAALTGQVAAEPALGGELHAGPALTGRITIN